MGTIGTALSMSLDGFIAGPGEGAAPTLADPAPDHRPPAPPLVLKQALRPWRTQR
jgi:hypothetical protein